MKKGFTLIELLAVIVILAIIALIATPMIMDVIEKSRRSAAIESVNGILESAETYRAEKLIDQEDYEQEINLTSDILKYKGSKPESGTLLMDAAGRMYVIAKYGNYCIEKKFEENAPSIVDKNPCVLNEEEIKKDVPIIKISSTEKTVNLVLKDQNGLSGYAITETKEDPTEWEPISGTQAEVTWTAEQSGIYYAHVKNVNNKISKSNFTISSALFCSYNPGDVVKTFEYKGEIEDYEMPCDGIYKLEVWGAEGGSYNTSCVGGKGGYSYGEIELKTGNHLYVGVGGQGLGDGSHATRLGGYNGGGSAHADADGNTRQASGGGATHIAFETGLLADLSSNKENIIIVAGGGGGGSANAVVMCTSGGSGGGEIGGNGGTYTEGIYRGTAKGGTQTESGELECVNGKDEYCRRGSFGVGASSISAGAGGGFYGGSVALTSASGGSGYLNLAKLKEGTTGMQNGERSGAGYAKITLVSFPY